MKNAGTPCGGANTINASFDFGGELRHIGVARRHVIDELFAAHVHRIKIRAAAAKDDSRRGVEDWRRRRDDVEVSELADFKRSDPVGNAHHAGAAHSMQPQDIDRLHDRWALKFGAQHVKASALCFEGIGDVGTRLAVFTDADLYAER